MFNTPELEANVDKRLKPSEQVKVLNKQLNQGSKAYLAMMKDINKNCKTLKKKMNRAEKFIGTRQQGKMYGYYTGLEEALDMFHSLFKMSELILSENEKRK